MIKVQWELEEAVVLFDVYFKNSRNLRFFSARESQVCAGGKIQCTVIAIAGILQENVRGITFYTASSMTMDKTFCKINLLRMFYRRSFYWKMILWDKILDKMIFLWRESKEETCSRKNLYEAEYDKAFDEFYKKYGFLGYKLQTETELEENRKRGCGGTVHFMNELSEYKDIYEKHRTEERKLEEYREMCKNEALDMLKEYFFSLWD